MAARSRNFVEGKTVRSLTGHSYCLLRKLFALAMGLLVSTSVIAEVWTYIDERGVAHFAPDQRDSRYQLFYRGGSSLDPVPPPAAPAPAPADLLFNHKLFLRVAQHPNLQRYKTLIDASAKTHGLEPSLIKAMIAVESAFEPQAVSPKGALGLMQIMPATGERYGVAANAKRTLEQQLFDPATNLRVGTRYLRDLLQRFDQNLDLALAAYNAGEGAVEQYARTIPPYPETRDYVALVQQFEAFYRPPPPPPPPAPLPPTPGRVTLKPRAVMP
ncbi:MAG: lytic transglycosylase domain-containing protein [Casimicrobiaceae bacterium]